MVFQYPRRVINSQYPVMLVSDVLVQSVLGSLVLMLDRLEGGVEAADHRLVSALSVVQLQLQGFVLRQQARPVGGNQVALEVFLFGPAVDVSVKKERQNKMFYNVEGFVGCHTTGVYYII